MRTNPIDIFSSYSKFTGELINEFDPNAKSEEPLKSNDVLNDSKEQSLFNQNEKYSLFSYIFDLHNLDAKLESKLGIIKSIKKGICSSEEIEITEFLKINPQLSFYRYILLKDHDRKYNIGYFTEMFRKMIKTLIELNIFFLDTYILCKIMDMEFNWEQLDIKRESKTKPLRIGCNNILMVEYKGNKPHLIINENGLRDFNSYNTTDKINLGLYSGNDLLFCQKVSVPKFSPDEREAIFKGDIGKDGQFKSSELLKTSERDNQTNTINYNEISAWLEIVGLKDRSTEQNK